MEQQPPLLVFQSFHGRDNLCRELGLVEGNSPQTRVEECAVSYYHRASCPNSLANVVVIRVPDGVVGFKARLILLSAHFGGHIFVFHPDLPPRSTLSEARHPRLVVNPRPEEYASALRIPLGFGDRTRHQMAAASAAIRRQQPVPQPIAAVRRQPPPVATVIQNLDDIFIQLQDHDSASSSSSDDDLQQAIRESLEEEARVAAEAANKVVPLEEDWKRVLKKSEPVMAGYPVCMVCLTSRASICFVDCGHQVACDECVEIMRTRTGVCKQCIVCRSDLTRIVRPIVSELAASAVAADSHESPAKRQCIIKIKKP
jgi:hypothetical protein